MLAGFLFFSEGSPQSTCKGEASRPLFPRVLKPPDLAVEIPDFHIAGVQELARGPQGLRVRFGVDRSVRRNAVVCIDQVSPIGRHDCLLSPRQRVRGDTGEQAAMPDPNGTPPL